MWDDQEDQEEDEDQWLNVTTCNPPCWSVLTVANTIRSSSLQVSYPCVQIRPVQNPLARLWMKLPLSPSLWAENSYLACAEVFYCYLSGVIVSLPGWLDLNYLQNQLKLKKWKWKETFYNFCTIFPTLQPILQLLKLGSRNLISLFEHLYKVLQYFIWPIYFIEIFFYSAC